MTLDFGPLGAEQKCCHTLKKSKWFQFAWKRKHTYMKATSQEDKLKGKQQYKKIALQHKKEA